MEGKSIYSESATDREARVQQLYERLAAFGPTPALYYRIHPDLASIEYLVASDLAAGESLSGSPEERARQFLLGQSALFGLQREQFDEHLFLKHVNRSLIGTHCIFGLRVEVEVDELSFVVHLDRDNHIVMVTAAYTPDALNELSQRARPKASTVRVALQEAVRQVQDRQPTGDAHSQPMWLTAWNRDQGKYEYTPGYQVKLTTRRGGDLVMHVAQSEGGQIDVRKQSIISASAAPSWIGSGNVFRDYWSPPPELKSVTIEEALQRDETSLKTVVLRDLESGAELIGRYVAVKDNVSASWPVANYRYDNDADLGNSMLDRVMAYYHVDLAQRYFRELGLGVLDEHEQLNPVNVVLDSPLDSESGGTMYNPIEARIHIKALVDECTEAREPRILYHEFVHAVTDALARLRRNGRNVAQTPAPRLRQALEAIAMDEGLADYFACSLAASHGATDAHFYPLVLVPQGETLTWDHQRTLGRSISEPEPPDLQVFDVKQEQLETMSPGDLEGKFYEWGEQWGRYLWALRCDLGAEIADTVIAHSILFLTRWSTFGQGVLAIRVADRLLFGGAHEKEIMKARNQTQVPDEQHPWGGWKTAKGSLPRVRTAGPLLGKEATDILR